MARPRAIPKASSGSREVSPKVRLLYHFCRLQLPGITLSLEHYAFQLRRMFDLFRAKDGSVTWEQFLEKLYPLDAFLCGACLERDPQAWEYLFAARTGSADWLLIDALRARAARLFPRDEERQENAVTEFWGHLLVAEPSGSLPVLARYDGQRPLVPWLIRVFQNRQISQLRSKEQRAEVLADDDLLHDRELPCEPTARWHEAFCEATRAWLEELADSDLLLLGLRLRYRLNQREIADLLGVHEGTISRQIAHLRDRGLEFIRRRLVAEGWDGEDLSEFIYSEMASLLLDEPRLAADNLARLLAAKKKTLPVGKT